MSLASRLARYIMLVLVTGPDTMFLKVIILYTTVSPTCSYNSYLPFQRATLPWDCLERSTSPHWYCFVRHVTHGNARLLASIYSWSLRESGPINSIESQEPCMPRNQGLILVHAQYKLEARQQPSCCVVLFRDYSHKTHKSGNESTCRTPWLVFRCLWCQAYILLCTCHNIPTSRLCQQK